jgi:spore coat polysaccharide biosynthesis protein SpsF
MRTHHAEQMHNIAQARNNSSLRLTLDTPEDLQVLEHMLEETPALQSGYEAIEDLLNHHPDWIAINAHIEQKKV